MYNWNLLDITHVLFLLVKLYPEMNVCERMSVSMTTTCNPMCALLTQWAFLWSTCGKWRGDGLGAEGVWFPPGGLRGYLRPEEPWRNAWLITKGVINYAGWGVQSHSVNIGLGGKKGGRRCFPPLQDMPVGLSLLWSCQEEAYLKARFAFMLFSLRKIPANSQTRHQIHWFTFSGEGKKKKITVS